MSEELIDRYVDRAAFADDTKFATDQLKTILDLFDKVNSTKLALSGSKSMKDVVTNSEAINKAMAELTAQNAKLQKSYDDLAKKYDELATKKKKATELSDEEKKAAIAVS